MIPSVTVIIWYSQLTTSDEPLGETLTLTLMEDMDCQTNAQ